jgi:ribosomal protein S18 acetylase RimI-like enzyme
MSGVSVRRMAEVDLSFCLDLLRLTGWGNTADDLRRMMSYEPGGCFIASLGGEDVGMVGSVSYGGVGWVGDLIVLPEHRGRGVGASLMRRAIRHLEGSGVGFVRLDSVAKAIPLYRRLGFREEYPSLRFMGIGRPSRASGVERMNPTDLSDVSKLDERFFGASRERVLRRVLHDFPDLCHVARGDPRISGYIMAKVGEGSHKIGPWICDPREPGLAEALLRRIMDEADGERLWVGVPGGNVASVEILKSNGFGSLPTSTRMCLGDCTSMGDVRGVFGIGAADKG